MSKKTKITAYYVRIDPRNLGDFGSVRMSDSSIESDNDKRIRMYKDICEEILSDVKRHVDQVGRVYVEAESEPVCEHCGYAWTEKSSTYNGGCCDKDEQANPSPTGILEDMAALKGAIDAFASAKEAK
jgi:hypothetical protein